MLMVDYETKERRRRRQNREAQRRWRERQRRVKALVADSGPVDIDEGLAWIRANLKVPTGLRAGLPFEIYDWQEKWVRAAYGEGIRSAGLSVARKNGKSGLIAALLLCHLAGPWNRTLWRGIVTSLTALLAKELRVAIKQIADVSGIRIDERLSPSPGILIGRNKAQVDFIAADKASGHAVGADIAIIDEMGLLPENKRPLVNAMFTAISARKSGKFWAISIQGDGPMFRELEARADEPSVHWQRWSAPSDVDLLDEEAWALANPGLGVIKELDYMRDSAARAVGSPSDQAYFRAYDLNQDLDPSREMIVSVTDWNAIYDHGAVLADEPVVLGIDLGGTVSMTAAVAIGTRSGHLYAWGAFSETPDLLQRGRFDGVDTRYLTMKERGELMIYPGLVVSVDRFIHDVHLDLMRRGCEVKVIGADRYRRAELLQALSETHLQRTPVVFRGQGASATADGSADVRAFQRLVLERRVSCRESLILESAIASSMIRRDGAGNPALDKAKSTGRIDALSAAVIAAGLYERMPNAELQYRII